MKSKKRLLVLVGSSNPVKIKAVEAVFKKIFKNIEVKGMAAASGVSNQPMSMEEAYLGADNRASCLKNKVKADYYVGIEAGMQKYSFGWVTAGVVVIIDKKNLKGISICPQILLPEKMVQAIKKGKELGTVLEEVSLIKDIKQKQGVFGYLTNNLITRQTAYEAGVKTALARFIKKKNYGN